MQIASRLEARHAEIEEAILTRLYAVDDSAEQDAEYLQGLRDAVVAAIAYALRGIERGDEWAGPVPVAMLAQARCAATMGVGIDTVLRRYVAGYTTLGDFLMQEACGGQDHFGDTSTLHCAQRELAVLFDRIVAVVSAEHGRESEDAHPTREQRLRQRIRRLLNGQLVDVTELGYDLKAWHLGAVATGPGAEPLLRETAERLDRRLLLVPGAEDACWAWLGGRREVEATELIGILEAQPADEDTRLAVGEPARGLAGWRLTHRQARAALRVSRLKPQPITLYADVALISSILRDEDHVAFLSETYLRPLSRERDGGATLRETLRAYFAVGRNASSAAAVVGVSRQTITNRLATIEQLLGRSLHTCTAELEAAVRLAAFEQPNSSHR